MSLCNHVYWNMKTSRQLYIIIIIILAFICPTTGKELASSRYVNYQGLAHSTYVMRHGNFMHIIEYSRRCVHVSSRFPSPLKLVVNFMCNLARKFRTRSEVILIIPSVTVSMVFNQSNYHHTYNTI